VLSDVEFPVSSKYVASAASPWRCDFDRRASRANREERSFGFVPLDTRIFDPEVGVPAPAPIGHPIRIQELDSKFKGSAHRPATELDAVSSFMIARNAGASLMGRIGALWRKNPDDLFAPARVAPSDVRFTEKDNDRTSGLKSDFTRESEFANRTVAG
jgi:hypothetical protein